MLQITWDTPLKPHLIATILTLISLFIHSEASCTRYAVLLMCQYTFPDVEILRKVGTGTDLILKGYRGALEVPKLANSGEYSIRTIQIQHSHITYIAPHFFAEFSKGGLTRLTLNNLNGTFQLDEHSLGGLENTLVTLRVTEHTVGDISYFANLQSLDRLQLTRTGLTSLPDNFKKVLDRITVLDLTGNELTALPWDILTKNLEKESFKTVRLNANKWHCDCRMRPLVEATAAVKGKITGLQCAEPPHLMDHNLPMLKVGHICSAEDSGEIQPVVVEPEESSVDNTVIEAVQEVRTGIGDVGPTRGDETLNDPPQLATAGSSLSIEIIAVIVAVIVVVVVVIIVIVIFKVRAGNQRSHQQATPKHPTHKNNPYCHVIEHPSSKPVMNSRSPGIAAAGPHPVGHYARELDEAERQPLAPPYHAQRDNRF